MELVEPGVETILLLRVNGDGLGGRICERNNGIFDEYEFSKNNTTIV